ncbi:hypothetical protein Tco_1350002, partial [Tanacetum coccineum]
DNCLEKSVGEESKKDEGKSPLCEIVTTREIYKTRLKIETTIAELVTKYEGNWPDGWSNEYPILK